MLKFPLIFPKYDPDIIRNVNKFLACNGSFVGDYLLLKFCAFEQLMLAGD